jgi:hypothetical protein
MLVKNGPQEPENWLLDFFGMENPKKLVPRRSADPPDSDPTDFADFLS